VNGKDKQVVKKVTQRAPSSVSGRRARLDSLKHINNFSICKRYVGGRRGTSLLCDVVLRALLFQTSGIPRSSADGVLLWHAVVWRTRSCTVLDARAELCSLALPGRGATHA